MTLRWLGLVDYREALDQQRAHREAVIRGEAHEAIWFLEHPPVVTVGRRDAGVDESRVRAHGFDLVATERGGLATCHEPGQLVAYVIVHARRGVRRLVCDLESAAIAACADLGVPAIRRPGAPGVYAAGGKVCAVGLHVRRGVTMHGLALNLVNDRRGFSLIAPCGEVGGSVSSVLAEAGRSPSPREAWPLLGAHLARALGPSARDRATKVDDRPCGE